VGSLPEKEHGSANAVEQATKNRFKVKRELDYVHYPSEVRWFREAQPGDQVVQMIRDAKGHVDVHAPGTFLTAESYPRERGRGKRRFIALMEPRDLPQSQIWSQFTPSSPW
jgi:hypothetical protein